MLPNAVSRETVVKLAHLVELVEAENCRQNLIAPSTIRAIWSRHIDDSLQLLDVAQPGRWLDVGTGGGFPGLVVAICRSDETVLVEPRAKRATFLEQAAAELQLPHVTVVRSKVEALAPLGALTISARAVAPLVDLLRLSHPHAAPGAAWLFPKGRNAVAELADAQRTWQGDFRLVPSRTDPEASIVMIRDLSPKPSMKVSR